MTRSGRAPGQQAKLDHLDTALALADRFASRDLSPDARLVAHVDVAEVAAAAGVSRTALYRLWTTQEAFRSDLARHLAERDHATWMTAPAAVEQPFTEQPRATQPRRELHRLMGMAYDSLRSSPWLILRAGAAGHPGAAAALRAIASREVWRVTHLADRLDRLVHRSKRRYVAGIKPLTLATAVTCLAEGLALQAHLTPTSAAAERQRRALLSRAAKALVEATTEPLGSESPPSPLHQSTGQVPPGPSRRLTRRREHYLQLAAGLALQPAYRQRASGSSLGYIGIDALARAEGVTRAAFRRIWPTQASFLVDLSSHLLGRHRQALVDQAAAASQSSGRGDPSASPLLALGDEILAATCAGRGVVSHLSIAPQLSFPAFRTAIQRNHAALMDSLAGTVEGLVAGLGHRVRPGRQHELAVLLTGFVDGVTRWDRTHQDTDGLAPWRRCLRPGGHSLFAVLLEAVVLGSGLTEPCGQAEAAPSTTPDLRIDLSHANPYRDLDLTAQLV